jgi:hypothetical protein
LSFDPTAAIIDWAERKIGDYRCNCYGGALAP